MSYKKRALQRLNVETRLAAVAVNSMKAGFDDLTTSVQRFNVEKRLLRARLKEAAANKIRIPKGQKVKDRRARQLAHALRKSGRTYKLMNALYGS